MSMNTDAASMESAWKANYPDVTFEESLPHSKLYTEHSTKSFGDKLTYPAYKYLPVSFIFCERDGTLPPDFQKKTIARIEEQSGRKVQVFTVDAGHCPFATQPEEVAGFVNQAINQD